MKSKNIVIRFLLSLLLICLIVLSCMKIYECYYSIRFKENTETVDDLLHITRIYDRWTGEYNFILSGFDSDNEEWINKLFAAGQYKYNSDNKLVETPNTK